MKFGHAIAAGAVLFLRLANGQAVLPNNATYDSALSAISSNATLVTTQSGLPVVDLGYTIHRAISFNSTGQFYNFSNIRYAAPPLGDLRFRAPFPPSINRSSIDDGSVGRICPQSFPAWEATAAVFVPQYLASQAGKGAVSKEKRQAPPIDPRTTEDCLFLDVVVPKKVLDAAAQGKKGAPVLVFIYGGGYTSGDKSGINGGSPAGLLQRSNNGIIYVGINYRLGAFGWLGGPKLRANGTANAGLWDQKLALLWIQTFISRFGGDPKQVTVMGESAGAGSIFNHTKLTAFGGKNNFPMFNRAIPQSPASIPTTSTAIMDSTLAQFLALCGVSTLAEARQLPSARLIAANAQQVGAAPYGDFVFGPTVDGLVVQGLPSVLITQGKYNTDVKVMAAHNSNEGLLFTNPNSVDPSTFAANVKEKVPTISQEKLDYVANTLYPPVFNGSQGYRDDVMRTAIALADIVFMCNDYALAHNSPGAYLYEWAVFPGLHAFDLSYTFYTGPSCSATAAASADTARLRNRSPLEKRQAPACNKAAVALQEWITSFAMTGKPTSTLGPAFPLYDGTGSILKLVNDTLPPIAATDDIVVSRVNYWISQIFPTL